MADVAALYVDPKGPYPSMPGVDCWDAERDARLYDGPHPVVAHPPCGNWTASAKLRSAYGRDDADCALRALEQVRGWGGVLEHPAGSRLWRAADLPPPGGLPDGHGGYTLAVRQCDWGHVAAKPTWLYVVGATVDPATFPTSKAPTHVCSGGKWRGTPRRKVCSAQQRRRTPPAFAEWLVRLARTVDHRTTVS